MRRVAPFVALLLPSVAAAQSSDTVYCGKLGDLALRYLGRVQDGANKPDPDTVVAIDRCQKGDTAGGIPILERKLRIAGFSLPER